MKVLVISGAFPPLRAGESDHTLHLCTRLAGQGLDVHLLTTKGCDASSGLPFTVWPIMRDWSWLELPRLARFLKRCAPDSVLLMYSGWIYHDHPMITFVPTITRRLLPKVRFVTQFEIGTGSWWRSFGTRIVRKLIQQWVGSTNVNYSFGTLLRDSHQLIVLSELHLAHFADLLPGVREKCVLIPPPPLLTMCQGGKAARANHNEFLLVFFGYADHGKGIETLFKAVQIVSRENPQVRLVMVGGGRGTARGAATELGRRTAQYEQDLSAMPEQLGIGDKVTWTPGYGWESDAGSSYLQAADAAVLPFDAGVTLNRSSFAAAAAHGLPIITTRGPQLESPFRDRDNVLLCPPEDAESLAVAIQSLLHDSRLRERLRTGVVRLAREWFSWERAVERTLETLQGGS